jgi:hypothetical protein
MLQDDVEEMEIIGRASGRGPNQTEGETSRQQAE